MSDESSTPKSNGSPALAEEIAKVLLQATKIERAGVAGVALQSLKQSSDWETRAREAETRAAHVSAYPGSVQVGDGSGAASGSGDEMGDLYLGDYRNENHYHGSSATGNAANGGGSSVLPTLLKLAAGAGLGAAGMYPLAASLLADGAKDVVEDVRTVITREPAATTSGGPSESVRYSLSLGTPAAD